MNFRERIIISTQPSHCFYFIKLGEKYLTRGERGTKAMSIQQARCGRPLQSCTEQSIIMTQGLRSIGIQASPTTPKHTHLRGVTSEICSFSCSTLGYFSDVIHQQL